jgi:hypothetical protein
MWLRENWRAYRSEPPRGRVEALWGTAMRMHAERTGRRAGHPGRAARRRLAWEGRIVRQGNGRVYQ